MLEVRSLSMTASTPSKSPWVLRITGTPPPPQAMTMWPLRAASEIIALWMTFLGVGEGTTRRQPRPASSTTFQPNFSRRSSASSFSRKGPTGLVGLSKAGS